MKRLFYIVASGCGLIVLSPLFLVVAIWEGRVRGFAAFGGRDTHIPNGCDVRESRFIHYY